MTNEQLIIQEITMLFISRNQTPLAGLLEQWLFDLKEYSPERIAIAFKKYRRYCDDFPSLPKLIKIIEDKADSKTEAAQLWQEVIKQSRALKPSSANLSEKAKWLINEVCDGLTTVINADDYTIGSIERDFKSMFKDYDTRSTKSLENPKTTLKELGLDTDKIGIIK